MEIGGYCGSLKRRRALPFGSVEIGQKIMDTIIPEGVLYYKDWAKKWRAEGNLNEGFFSLENAFNHLENAYYAKHTEAAALKVRLMVAEYLLTETADNLIKNPEIAQELLDDIREYWLEYKPGEQL